MADVIELLDRQYQRLQGRDGAAWLQELPRFYGFITEGPAPVTAALGELRGEGEARAREFEKHDEEMVPELVRLRDELVARAPEADDSGVSRPRGRTVESMEWQFGLSNFDELAALGPDRVVVQQGADASRSGMMLRILEQKLRRLQWTETNREGSLVPSETDQRLDLDDLARQFRNLNDRHRHAAQEFSQALARDGGFQVLFLDMAVDQMNPAPREITTDDELRQLVGDTLKRVGAGWHYVEDAVSGQPLDERGRQAVEIHVRRLRPSVEAVYEDLRMKLGTMPGPPAVTPSYGEKLRMWVLSPGYALVGGPCIAGAITGLVSRQPTGLWIFVGLAVLLAMLPPFVSRLPQLRFARAPWVFAVLTSAVVVFVLAAVDVVAAILAFAVLTAVFLLGQRAASENASTPVEADEP